VPKIVVVIALAKKKKRQKKRDIRAALQHVVVPWYVQTKGLHSTTKVPVASAEDGGGDSACKKRDRSRCATTNRVRAALLITCS
jgi:hypothetical protein